MEKKMKFNVVLRLEEIALRNFIICSWIPVQKRLDFTTINEEPDLFWGINWEDVVQDNISETKMPEKIKKEMIDVVGPIGAEVRNWLKFHRGFYPKNVYPDLTELCWTSLGCIDDQKTAEKIVCSNISVETRYKFACHYCLEEYIPFLWLKLSKERKAYYSGNYHQCSNNQDNHFDSLVFAWPHILSGEVSKDNYFFKGDGRIFASFSQWAFEYSVKTANKSATEYFYHKLTYCEKKDSLMRSANTLLENYEITSQYFDVLCYLLTLMTFEQQKVMVEKHPVAIVTIFLFCPIKHIYVENASFIWTFFPPSDYDHLLMMIVFKFQTSHRSSGPLFREFFIHSPPGLKKRFVNESLRFPELLVAKEYLDYFFGCGDRETLEVVFRNLEKADRLKLVFHPQILRYFYDSILNTNWSMVELCLREVTLSKEDKTRWKEEFIFTVFRIRFGQIKRRDPQWRGFFEFFDETPKEEKGQKRKHAELQDECSTE